MIATNLIVHKYLYKLLRVFIEVDPLAVSVRWSNLGANSKMLASKC